MDHLFCVGARGSGFESMSKVACETAAALPGAGTDVQLCGRDGAGSDSPRAGDDPDAPADSVLLRVPDGVDLTHLFGAAALRRDGSTKGSSNPKAAAEAATRKGAPRAADSRRLLATATAIGSKTAVVIGVLPASKVVVAKERRARAPGRVVVARAWRRPAAGARVFASEAVVGPEPVSPKVSCFGAVLSETSAAAPPPGTQEEGSGGCWASLGTAFLGLFYDSLDHGGHLPATEPNSRATAPESQGVAVMSPPRPVAPGLGDVKPLASRRWPETMAPGTV